MELSWTKRIGFSWDLIQTYGSIGRGWINSIKVINTDSIYAGARNSGLWFTDNGGDSWKNISESEPLINGIYSILIDPSNSNHIIVLTGRVTSFEFNSYSNGIFETFDHGQTWSSIPVNVNNQNIYPTSSEWEFPVKLVYRNTDFNDLYLITKSSLYRKIDNNEWERIYHNDFYNKWHNDITFDKLDHDIFYIGELSYIK